MTNIDDEGQQCLADDPPPPDPAPMSYPPATAPPVRGVASREGSGCSCETSLDLRRDGPGQVMFVFNESSLPDEATLRKQLAGFDDWAYLTLEQPMVEMYVNGEPPLMPFTIELPPEDGADGVVFDSRPLVSNADQAAKGAGAGLIRASWPYYYRFLAPYDPSVAQILAGADLRPVPLQPGATFEGAASRAEMTFRHTRTGGNVPQIGTDRISTGQKMSVIYRESLTRGTGEIVRIDPAVVGRSGETFVSAKEVLQDLDQMERQFADDLAKAKEAGRGKNAIRRIEGRLDAVKKARLKVRGFGEGHGVGRIPSASMSKVGSMGAEVGALRVTQGLKVGGGILIVYGVYSSLDRIAEAPPELRERVTTQEVGGWAGGFAGAWAGAKVFAAGGAALGIETGPGAIVTGLVGGVAGGIIGGIGGALGADWVYSLMDEETDRKCCKKALGRRLPETRPGEGFWTQGPQGRVWREPGWSGGIPE